MKTHHFEDLRLKVYLQSLIFESRRSALLLLSRNYNASILNMYVSDPVSDKWEA